MRVAVDNAEAVDIAVLVGRDTVTAVAGVGQRRKVLVGQRRQSSDFAVSSAREWVRMLSRGGAAGWSGCSYC
jgi:hypothetical protein